MATYRLLTYMVLDELKGQSDDFEFNEDHAIFLLDKWRAFLIKLKYLDIKKDIPESNYQTICLDLIQVPPIDGEPCEGNYYLRSKEKIPTMLNISEPIVSTLDYYQGNITYINSRRMRYVGHNKYLKNIIYCSLNPDNYLYFTSNNPLFLYLEKVKLTGIFDDSEEANKLQCNEDGESNCDILDLSFPIEDALIPPLLELVIKELVGAKYRPNDTLNNAKDDLTGLNVK